MNLSKLFLLTLLLFLGTVSTNSYANIVYQNRSTVAKNYPVDKKKSVKKKQKKLRKKGQKKAFFKRAKRVTKAQVAGEIIGLITISLLLLLPIIFMIIGGITGGLGWIIAGSILMGLWLIIGYILAFSQYSGLPYLGVIICLFFFLACFALFLWALIVVLPLILILSIIFGSIAFLGFLLLIFITISQV